MSKETLGGKRPIESYPTMDGTGIVRVYQLGKTIMAEVERTTEMKPVDNIVPETETPPA